MIRVSPLLFGAALLWAPALAAPHSPVSSCGEYRLRGTVRCQRPRCELILHEGSPSQWPIPLKNLLPEFERLHGQTVEVELHVDRLAPLAARARGQLLPAPLFHGQKDIRLIRGAKCR